MVHVGKTSCFCIFYRNVSFETKSKMVYVLKNEENDELLKRLRIDPDVIHQKDFQDFVTSNTLRFFEIIDLSSDLS